MKRTNYAILERALAAEAEKGFSNETRAVRVLNGVYSMRGAPGRYMIRIRVPAGVITAEQLDAVADITQFFGSERGVHLTTRQGIELTNVESANVVAVLNRLEEAGLTTWRTGGNGVRGVVCCQFAGCAPDELFDVTPYAVAVDRMFREEPFQNLPRKIKISFEGCTTDHVRTGVSDIGLRAVIQDGKRGFRVRVGGGLGASPRLAEVLEEFTSATELFATIDAILSVFREHGNRANRARSRLKWLIAEWGIERFREAVFAERANRTVGEWCEILSLPEVPALEPPEVEPPSLEPEEEAPFSRWRNSNVWPQKDGAFVAVQVRCPLGDLLPSQLRRLAAAARRFAGGVRISIEQNILLRWVRPQTLSALYQFLAPAGLSLCCAEQIADVTRCAGAVSCLSAITNSAAAALAIEQVLNGELARDPVLRLLRVRVSGCFNSCSHHHAADIGLFGISKRLHGKPVPHYAMILGGSVDGSHFGSRFVDVPAQRVADAVRLLLRHFRDGRQSNERFEEYVQRERSAILQKLEPVIKVPPPEDAPAFYQDLGSEEEFALAARAGECSA